MTLNFLNERKRFVSLLFILFSTAQIVSAQDAVKRLDSLFTDRFEKSQLNANVLIAENGTVVYQHSFGLADMKKRIPLTVNSRFHLASTSKLFTAVAVLQLYEKGKIKLDDPVIKYLPDFPYSNVKIRHLLTHTSGLPDFQIFEPYYEKDPNRILTNTDLIPAIKKYGKLQFVPGEKWSYSSPGIALLADIVEKVSRLKFEQYLKKYVWLPAGMHHSYINSLSAPVNDENRVNNYAKTGLFSDSLQVAENIPRHREFARISGALIGPGLIVSDVHDLFLFDQALYKGKLLSAATMAEAFTPIKLNNGDYAHPEPFLGKTGFGLGWFLFTENPDRKVVLHTGKQGGIITVFIRDITKKRTFVLLENSESSGLNNTTLNAMRILDRAPLQNLKESLAFTYAKDIVKKGIDYAVSHFNQFKSDTAHYYLNLFEMHYVGHELIGFKHPEQGMETLRLLTQIDGNNWYPYFSYGKALLEAGKKEEAAMNLNKANLISPDNEEVLPLLKQLMKN